MNVEIFTLCDAAVTDQAGKMSLLGSFDRVNAIQAPISCPICYLAIKLRFQRIEEGVKQMRIGFVDSDGKPVLPTINAQVAIQTPPDGSAATAQVCLLIQQLKLPSFGEYSIDLAVDGLQVASLPLYVRQIQLAPPQQPPPETPGA